MVSSNSKLLLLLIVQIVGVVAEENCNKYFEVNADPLEIVAKYVSSLIKIESSKDSSMYHDVALIQIELNNKSEAFSAIISEVMKRNPRR